MTGLPFPYIEVSILDGKLHMTAGEQAGDITPAGEADKFSSPKGATIQFIRDGSKK